MAFSLSTSSLGTLFRFGNFFAQSLLLYSLIAQLSSVLTTASPVALPESASDWFHDQLYPKPGTDPSSEIECYSLPYGALGFISHLLTFYTAAVIGIGRKPLLPCLELNQSKWHIIWDIFVNTVSMIFTVVLAGFTISSCRNSWPFVLLAMWKLMLGFVQPLCTIVASVITDKESGIGTFSGFFVYGLAGPMGAVGIFEITHLEFGDNPNVRIITYVLVGIVAIIMLVSTILACTKESSYLVTGIGLAFLVFMLYSDWILAAIQHNWVGMPDDKHKALYWAYWAAKRLPMLCLYHLRSCTNKPLPRVDFGPVIGLATGVLQCCRSPSQLKWQPVIPQVQSPPPFPSANALTDSPKLMKSSSLTQWTNSKTPSRRKPHQGRTGIPPTRGCTNASWLGMVSSMELLVYNNFLTQLFK